MPEIIYLTSIITKPRANNVPTYGIAPPDKYLCYYGDNKMKTQSDTKVLKIPTF